MKLISLTAFFAALLIFSTPVLAIAHEKGQPFDFSKAMTDILKGVLPSSAIVTEDVLKWPNVIYFYFVPLIMFGVFMYDLFSVATWPRTESMRKAFAILVVILMVPSGLAITVASYLYGIGFLAAYVVGGMVVLFTAVGFVWRRIMGGFGSAKSEASEAKSLVKEVEAERGEIKRLSDRILELDKEIEKLSKQAPVYKSPEYYARERQVATLQKNKEILQSKIDYMVSTRGKQT